MQRFRVPLVGAAFTVLLLAAAGARATPSTILITENWEPAQLKLYANGFSSGNDHYVSYTDENSVTVEVPVNGAQPPSSILATNLKTVSSQPTAASADHVNADYTLSVVLTNNATNDSAPTLFFKGHLDALFAQHYASTNMADTFYYDSSNNHVQSVTKSVVLDGYTIFITLGPFTPFSNPNSQNNGSIGGVMFAQVGTGPGPGPNPNGSPEPSTLMMSFLGLSGLGLASWRKWRRRVA
jgi:hypothetical protein